MMETSATKDTFIVQNGLLNGSSNDDASSTVTDTDGNLFPTLILTSAGVPGTQGGSSDHVIPMRLYASLTSAAASIHPSTSDVSVTDNSINGSILTTTRGTLDTENDNNDNATCILMTHHHHGTGGDDDLHQFVANSGGVISDLGGYGSTTHSTNETNDLLRHHHESTQPHRTLGTTTILMNECYGSKTVDDLTLTKLSSSSTMDDYGVSPHGKLKDILMNGNSHHHHLQSSGSTLLSSTSSPSTNVDNYLLHDLVYSNDSRTLTSGSNDDDQQSVNHATFTIPKEEDEELEELKLHSVAGEEQSSFNDTINSIYGHHQLSTIYSSSGGVISATGSQSSTVTIAPTSSSSSSTLAPSVIWTTSGGSGGVVVDSDGIGTSTLSLPPAILQLHHDPHLVIFKDEDIVGDLDGIDDDDLLEAKEERDDDDYLGGEYGDGDETQGGLKGELKCKFCGFVCCSKSSLGIHERRHTGERPFACK